MDKPPIPKFVFSGLPRDAEIDAHVAAMDPVLLEQDVKLWHDISARPNALLLLKSLASYASGDIVGALEPLKGVMANPAMVAVGHLLRGYYALKRGELGLATNGLNAAIDVASSHPDARYGELRSYIISMETAIDKVGPSTLPSLHRYRALRKAGPTVFVVSYPRSGNTLVMNVLKYIFDVNLYSVFKGDGRYFSTYAFDNANTNLVIVKDHLYQTQYIKEKTVVLVRDGRDCMVSLFQFLLRSSPYAAAIISKMKSFSEFLKWVAFNYEFGFWGDSVALATEAADAGAAVSFFKYESFTADAELILQIARSIASDRIVHQDREGMLRHMKELEERVKAIPEWGFSAPPRDENFAGWFRNRGKSNWRDVFDPEARQAFNELGGTEFLLRFGYETDPDWWKRE